MNFIPDLTESPQIFAFTVRELVPDDSDVWLYIDLFRELDLSDFDSDYSSQGGAAMAPEIMLRSIFYGLTHGIVSGRKLAAMCRSDLRLMVLSGESRPDARTFHRFLIRHESRLMQLFAEIVQVAQRMGLVDLGHVSIDGSRFKASTSKHKAMSHDRMTKAVEQLERDLSELRSSLAEENAKSGTQGDDTLPEEIAHKTRRLEKIRLAKEALEKEKAEKLEPQHQKSFNDHDALPMSGKGKGFEYGYNCQAAVDSVHQIVVGATVHDNQSDAGAAEELLKDIEASCSENPKVVSADAGYNNDRDLKAIEGVGAESLVATGKGEAGTTSSVVDQLVPGEGKHEFSCINGKMIPIKTKHKDGSTTLQFPGTFCNGCPLKEFCKVKAKKGKPFKLAPKDVHERKRVNRARTRSEAGKEAYKKRKVIVEPVFGNIKNKGLKILVTGNRNVCRWWKMTTTAHNIEKIVGHLQGISASSFGATKAAMAT